MVRINQEIPWGGRGSGGGKCAPLVKVPLEWQLGGAKLDLFSLTVYIPRYRR